MTPKYEQLVQRLRAALPQWYADGQRKLPGEQALAAQLSVSRQTLRQALAVLEQEGLIEKRRGSGSFLCPAAARQDRPDRRDRDLAERLHLPLASQGRAGLPFRAGLLRRHPRHGKLHPPRAGYFGSSCCSIPRRGSWSRDARRRCRTRTRSSIRRSGSAGCR